MTLTEFGVDPISHFRERAKTCVFTATHILRSISPDLQAMWSQIAPYHRPAMLLSLIKFANMYEQFATVRRGKLNKNKKTHALSAQTAIVVQPHMIIEKLLLRLRPRVDISCFCAWAVDSTGAGLRNIILGQTLIWHNNIYGGLAEPHNYA